MENFHKMTSVLYGCLVVDFKQDTPDNERLKSGKLFTSYVPPAKRLCFVNVDRKHTITHTTVKHATEACKHAIAHPSPTQVNMA